MPDSPGRLSLKAGMVFDAFYAADQVFVVKFLFYGCYRCLQPCKVWYFCPKIVSALSHFWGTVCRDNSDKRALEKQDMIVTGKSATGDGSWIRIDFKKCHTGVRLPDTSENVNKINSATS